MISPDCCVTLLDLRHASVEFRQVRILLGTGKCLVESDSLLLRSKRTLLI
jgi:hypothetical protein